MARFIRAPATKIIKQCLTLTVECQHRHFPAIDDRILCRNVKRFQGGLVVKAHRLLYHSTLGSRVIKQKKKKKIDDRKFLRFTTVAGIDCGRGSGFRVQGAELRV